MNNGELWAGVMWIAAFVIIYLLPSIVACSRHHRNATGIFLLNLLLGWTLLGWVGALIWSVLQDKPANLKRFNAASTPPQVPANQDSAKGSNPVAPTISPTHKTQ